MFNKSEERKQRIKITKRQQKQNLENKLKSILDKHKSLEQLKSKIDKLSNSKDANQFSNKKYLESLKAQHELLVKHSDSGNVNNGDITIGPTQRLQNPPRLEPKKLYTRSIYHDEELNPLGTPPVFFLTETTTIPFPNIPKPSSASTIEIRSNIENNEVIPLPNVDKPKYFKLRGLENNMKTSYEWKNSGGVGTNRGTGVGVGVSSNKLLFVPNSVLLQNKKRQRVADVEVAVETKDGDRVDEEFGEMAEEEEEYWKAQKEGKSILFNDDI